MENVLIVTDLDGTLLNKQHEVSSMNEKWIKKFKASGGLFTFATGRMENTTLSYIEKLGIDLPIISYNGAKIYCPITKSAIYEKELCIPESIWALLLENQRELGIFIYHDGKPFILERNDIVEEFEKKERILCVLRNLGDFIDKPVTKVLVIMKAVSRTEEVPKLKEIEQGIKMNDFKCETVFSESNYLEILPQGISKGVGLSKLKEHLGIQNLYTVAFGDNLNDISLLKAADLGIAVQNARQELKDNSDIVAPHSNDEDAIAHVIEKILNEEELVESKDWIFLQELNQ